jgi:hypothetical protein
MAKKASNAVKNVRVDEVIDLIAQRKKRSEIIEYVRTELKWDLQPSSVDLYIRHAHTAIRLLSKQKRTENMSEALLDLHHLYRSALRVKDYSTALSVRKELSKLQRLYDDVSPADKIREAMDDEEMDEEVDRLLEGPKAK